MALRRRDEFQSTMLVLMVNGMDAPTQYGHRCAKVEIQRQHSNRIGASIMQITTVGIDLAKNMFVRPESRVSFCFTGTFMT